MKIMDEKKLLEEYISFFGDEPPIPPIHIMKTLVKMKKDGTFDEKMKQKPKMEPFIKKVEELYGEKMSMDHPFLDIDYHRTETVNISLSETFDLLLDSMKNKSTKELLNTCRKIQMEECVFHVPESNKGFPELENGYSFVYKTDSNGTCSLDILDKDNELLQVELKINSGGTSEFPDINKFFNILKEYCDQYFSPETPTIYENNTVVKYQNELLVSFVMMDDSISQVINFQIGNRLLWEQIFREENKEIRMKLYSIKFFCDKCDCDIFYSISKKENDKGNLVYMGSTIESYLGENVVCHKCGDNHIVTDNDGLVSSTIIKRNN